MLQRYSIEILLIIYKRKFDKTLQIIFEMGKKKSRYEPGFINI